MKIELPIQKKEIIENEIKVEKSKKIFDLDMSLAGQLRYEAKFPELADKEDLVSYSQRVSSIDSLTVPVIISNMKALYCWFDTDITFVEFLKMFDFSDKEYVDELSKKIKEVLVSMEGPFAYHIDGEPRECKDGKLKISVQPKSLAIILPR